MHRLLSLVTILALSCLAPEAEAQWRRTILDGSGTALAPHVLGMTDFTALGDTNGDGICDFAFGNWGYGDPSHPDGYVVVFSGADLSILHVLADGYAGENYGAGVIAVGDADGDGLADVGVTAAGGYNGVIYIYSGLSGAVTNVLGSLASSLYGYNAYGQIFCEVGDPSYAGYRGLATMAPYADVYNSAYYTDPINEPEWFIGAGEVQMVGPYTGNRTFLGEASYQSIGYSLSLPGDVNGNGFQDCCFRISGGVTWNGGVVDLVIRDGGTKQIIRGYDSNSFQLPLSGPAVASLGDLNGDGMDDYVIGVDGRAVSGADGSLLYGFTPGTAVGCGDVDGDGLQDFMTADRVHSGADGSVLVTSLPGGYYNNPWDVNFGGIGDFDGDGVKDCYYLLVDYATGTPQLKIEIDSLWGAKRYGENLGGLQTLDLAWVPGGQSDPAIGALEVTGADPGALGLMAVSLAPASYDFLGLEVLVDPDPLNLVYQGGFGFGYLGEFSAAANIRSPWVGGSSFHFQAFQTWPALAASNGLELRFVP